MDNNSEMVILKVSGQTVPHALRSAVGGYISDGKTVSLDCIGVAPNYVATKVIIMVRGYLATRGKVLDAYPCFCDIKLDNPVSDVSVKTGIRWILRQKDE